MAVGSVAEAVGSVGFSEEAVGSVGFPALVQIGYPLLGWVCALCLLALIPFLGEEAP